MYELYIILATGHAKFKYSTKVVSNFSVLGFPGPVNFKVVLNESVPVPLASLDQSNLNSLGLGVVSLSHM